MWNYRMPGKLTYRVSFFLFMAAGLWWLYNLVTGAFPGYQPCVEDTTFLDRGYDCEQIRDRKSVV